MRANRKHITLILLDVVLVIIALWFSYALRFDWKIPPEYLRYWVYITGSVALLRISCFIWFGLYQSLWRYSSLPELLQIIKAISVSSLVIFLLNSIISIRYIPRSVLIIDWVLCMALVGGFRLFIRLRRETLRSSEVHDSRKKRILVVGAGQAGAMMIREMLHEHSGTHQPVAVVDDDPDKVFHRLHGAPIAGRIEQLKQVAIDFGVDEILVAIPSASKNRMREIIKLAKETGLSVRILPGFTEMTRGEGTFFKQVREVRIEDLLGREPVKKNLAGVAEYLRGERVLITGAGGSIGSELCRQIAGFKPSMLLLLGKGENSIYEINMELDYSYSDLNIIPLIADVRDRNRIEQIFTEFRPTVVFHAAAHKHVPLMEASPDEAVKNNIFGTKNVAELADKYQAKRFVLISTDKAVNPTSIMGSTKRVAEMIIQHLALRSRTKYCAVRFGNVLGSRGSVIPLFQKQIMRGGPVTITHPEMVRYFMTIPEAVTLVIQAGAMGNNGEIFILDMGEPIRIVDLATDLIRFSGLEPGRDIEIKYCGVRPGEKLFEEILTAEEGTTATRHERIYVGKPNGINWDKLQSDLVYLEKWVSVADRTKVVEKLKQMVPKYQPSAKWIEELAPGQDEL